MNHPSREELAELIYGELGPERHGCLQDHLEACPECRAQVETWQQVRRELAAWELAPAHPTPTVKSHAPWWRQMAGWRLAIPAAAAAVLILAGFEVGRLSPSGKATAPSAQRAMAEGIRQDLRAELARFNAEQAARHQDDRQTLARALGQLEANRLLEYARLRRDMETLAVRTEDELLNTRQNLIRLTAAEPLPR